MIDKVLKSTNFYRFFKGTSEDLTNRWSESHRYFHSLAHLKKILNLIERDKDNDIITRLEYDVLRVSAIYHDIVYLPREDSININESIAKFKEDFPELPYMFKDKIIEIIYSTNFHNFEDSDKLTRLFNSYDMNGILNGDLETLIEDGDNVAKEYHLEPEVYKVNRIKFLEKYKKYNPNIQKCIDYLNKQV